MIVRVFGRVDGVEVIYNHIQGDIWQVPVPLDQDGEYAVGIIAEDDTGNQTYLARMLYTVTAGTICVHPLPLPKYCFTRRLNQPQLTVQQAYWFKRLPAFIQVKMQPPQIQFSRVYPVCQGVVP